MIRDRRPEDLAPLSEVVAALRLPAQVLQGRTAAAWLDLDTATESWVYDMAPVHVAPTLNVVGHVQIYRPTPASETPGLADVAGRPADDLLAIGRLVVKPQKHDHGIARHLLNEARKHIERHGRTAVLDLHANGYLTREFCERYGFTGLTSDDPATAPMIHLG